MDIKEIKNEDGTLVLALCGRLDSITSHGAEEDIISKLNGITNLELDFNELTFVSSAGLRVLLSIQKRMNTAGKMTLKNVHANVKEVLDMTGLSDYLVIIP
ncbi:MAG: STAS domain-containing protein [Thermoguttaceae bacterium]